MEEKKMANITAGMVKELREMTGAGMMDCKKALAETDGDMDAAVEFLRKNGQAKAEKKAGRIAAEGLCKVVVKDDKTAAVVEVNSETDFVAKNEEFQNFVVAVAQQAVESDAADMDAFLAEKWNLDVGLDDLIPLFFGPLPEFDCLMLNVVIDFLWISAGIIDQNVDSSVFFYYSIYHGLDFSLYGKVVGQRDCLSTVIFNQPYCFIQVCLCSCDSNDSGTFSSDSQCSFTSDSLSGAGYDGDFSF